jgi:hypothetical protein
MSLIPKTKFGNCCNCPAKNTEVIKVDVRLLCIKCRNKEKVKKMIEKSALKKIEDKYRFRLDEEKAGLIEDLDDVVSKYVRIKNSDKVGWVKCFTCDGKNTWKSMDCGHFISRKHMGLRWDLRNLRPQCKFCNQVLSGNLNDFQKNLELETPGIADQLISESYDIIKYSRQEMKEMLIMFREKLRMAKTIANT